MKLNINDNNLNFTPVQWKQFIIQRLNLSEGLTICEVGIGEYTKCHIQSFLRTNNQLILVEALPRFNKEIQAKVRKNKNVIHHQIAISNTTGTVEFNVCGIESYIKNTNSVAQIRKRHFNTITVPCTTFNIIDPGNIDVLFIDIEGAEYYVLQHLVSRPKIIRIELNLPEFTNSFETEIKAWLFKNSYEQTDTIGSDIIYTRSTND